MAQESKIYLSDDVAKIRALHADLVTVEARSSPVRDWLDAQAQRIFEAHAKGNAAVVPHITCWHPGLVGKKADEILGCDFSLEDARETIAREYGFACWERASCVEIVPDPAFENAVDCLLNGDVDRLREVLQAKPQLANQRSAFGHEATLLHYVGSNGVETWRQVVPRNLAEITEAILDAGADVNAKAKIYGECSTLALLTSSAHPKDAGVTKQVEEVLLKFGAE